MSFSSFLCNPTIDHPRLSKLRLATTPDHDLGWIRTLRLSRGGTTIGLQISLHVSVFIRIRGFVRMTDGTHRLPKDDNCFRRFQWSGPGEGASLRCLLVIELSTKFFATFCSSTPSNFPIWWMQNMVIKVSTSRWCLVKGLAG